MKVRFVGGPFGGQAKSIITSDYGRNEIVMRGPKKMTRKKRYEYMVSDRGSFSAAHYPSLPIVEARYRISMRIHNNGTNLVNMPCMHPDGSLFYEYVEGSKTEL